MEAAKNIMRICDLVVTPSPVIAEKFSAFNPNIKVIPNSIDLNDGWPVLTGIDSVDKAKLSGIDGVSRILWQGSATHESDWLECVDAVEVVLRKRDKTRLVLLGLLPALIRERINKDPDFWRTRIEWCGFNDVESYTSVMKSLRAEVALAPLQSSEFNKAKSCLKFVEYTAVGCPTIASNTTPYKEVIDGNNGALANSREEWQEKIETFLDNPDTRLQVVKQARKTVSDNFNIRDAAKIWESIL
jgi:glycosyltransferase involved in cell wall biosynthesis